MSQSNGILGLDIGGANLKAAHSDGVAQSVPFALWKHPELLAVELDHLVAGMPPHEGRAITMTGELCDCFATKRDGVQAILRSVQAMTQPRPTRVWSTFGRFLAIDEARDQPYAVAAANWLALAWWVARRFPTEAVLLIDVGSTTTDIVYLRRGVPEPSGLTDPDRLATGGLVYTGVRRTPVCAVMGMEVAAEFFATMQDAYLVLGLVPEDCSDCNTADGRPADVAHAHARLARLRCADVAEFPMAAARDLAERAVAVQCQAVRRAVECVVRGKPAVERVVVAGSGEILARRAVEGFDGLAVTSLAEMLGPRFSEAACAFAVARLAAEE